MAINFTELPQENPYALPAIGLYYAKIVEAEMRASKTKNEDGSTKPDYLNLRYLLFDKNHKACGSMYDMITESDKPVARYKLARFLRACGIPLQGSMELKDIAKLVRNKEIVVDVNHDKPTNGNAPKAQVNLFEHEGYYLSTEFTEIYNAINSAPAADGAMNEGINSDASEVPFDAPDGDAPMNKPSANY